MDMYCHWNKDQIYSALNTLLSQYHSVSFWLEGPRGLSSMGSLWQPGIRAPTQTAVGVEATYRSSADLKASAGDNWRKKDEERKQKMGIKEKQNQYSVIRGLSK